MIVAFSLLWLADPLLTGRALLPLDNLLQFPPWRLDEQTYWPYNGLLSDAVLQNLAWKTLVRDALLSGELPLWNPFVLAGVPLLAAGQAGALYPPGVLFLLMDLYTSYGWYTLLHLLLIGLGTYLFARRLGLAPAASLASALAFEFSLRVTVVYLWPMVVGAISWLPLTLWATDLLARQLLAGRRNWGPAAAAVAAFTGLQLLAGHLEYAGYSVAAVLAYALYRTAFTDSAHWRRRLLTLGVFAGAMGLGVLLASAQLAPFFEYARGSSRAATTPLAEVLSYALPKRQPITFFMPDFFGNPSHHYVLDWSSLNWTNLAGDFDGSGFGPAPFWGVQNYVEGSGYVGIATLALAFLAVLRSRRSTWFFLALGLISAAMAFGAPIVYEIFYRLIPLADQLRTPFRWLLPLSFCLAMLAGHGLQALIDLTKQEDSASMRRLSTLVGSVWALAGLGCIVVFAAALLFRQAALEAIRELATQFPRMLDAYPDLGVLLDYQLRNLFLLGIFALATGALIVWILRRPSRWVVWLVPLLIFLDLGAYGYSFNSRISPEVLGEVEPPYAQSGSSGRVGAFGPVDVLPANTAVLFGIEDVRGYESLIPNQYVEYWRAIEHPGSLMYNRLDQFYDVASLDSRLLDLLSVQFVVSGQPIDHPSLQPISSERGIWTYRRTSMPARAFFVNSAVGARDQKDAIEQTTSPELNPFRTAVLEGADVSGTAPRSVPGGDVEVLREQVAPSRVALRVDAPVDGFVVLLDSFAPGWEATINDQSETIYRAYGNFRAVEVSAGQSEIIFRYSPLSLRVGFLLSALAGLSIVVLLAAGPILALFHRRADQSALENVAWNSVVPTATSLLNKAIDFGFALIMLRILGPEGIGKYSFAIVIVGLFEILSNFGLNTWLIRELSRAREERNSLLAMGVALRLTLITLLAPVLVVIALVWRGALGMADDTLLALLILGLGLLPGTVANGYSSHFYAAERLQVPAFISVVINVLKVVGGVAALVTGQGIVGLAVVSFAMNLLNALIVGGMAISDAGWQRPSIKLSQARTILFESLPLMLNHLLATVFFKIDVLIIDTLQGSRELGLYSAAYKFVDGLLIIPSTLTFALFPLLSRLTNASPAAAMRTVRQGIRVLLLLAFPIAAGITLLAEELVLLVAGPDYLPRSAEALRVLIWFLPFSYVNGLVQYLLIALEKQRFITICFLGAAIFNIAGNLILIPIYGIIGAGIITVLSELVLVIPFARLAGAEFRILASMVSFSWRPIVSTAVMGAAVLLVRDDGLILAVLVGIIVYPLVLTAIGGLEPAERQVIRRKSAEFLAKLRR